METLFVSREATLKRRENTIFITTNGSTRPFPVEKIRHIVLLSESRLNAKLLCLCGSHGVRISVFDYYGYFKGAFEPIDQSPSGRVKLKQAASILDDKERMIMAREFVNGAAHNMKANLLYYQYRGVKLLEKATSRMERLIQKISSTINCAGLMGIEGNLHNVYYAAWPQIHESLNFAPRIRRPPNSPINCLISFFNQMVYTVVRHEIFKTHLDQSLSWLHSPSAGRASLSLDIAEMFKPLLTDVLIFKMARKGMIRDNWFEIYDGVCLLTETGKRHVAENFSVRLEETIQGRSYREWIYREALNIERHLMDVAEYEAFRRRV